MPHGSSNKAHAGQASVDTGALIAENASLRDRMLRALADAENTRRRADRTAVDTSRYAITSFARELLPVADNLERTLVAAEQRSPAGGETAALVEGVRATQRALTRALAQFGVRRIEALGAPFDPTFHEAVIEVDDALYPPGTVVSVVEDGYMIHDRLLRPARVAVSRRRAEEAPAPTDSESHPHQDPG